MADTEEEKRKRWLAELDGIRKKLDNKNYSAGDVLTLLSRFAQIVSSGDWSKTVFGKPEDASQYDVLSESVRKSLYKQTSEMSNLILSPFRTKRALGVSSALGLGTTGVDVFKQLHKFVPGLVENVLGHSGARDAVDILTSSSNGLASAMGLRPGSISNPRDNMWNMTLMRYQGGLAYGNAFEKFTGAVDPTYTKGLSLPQTMMISRGILSNRDFLRSFVRDEVARGQAWDKDNPGATREQRMAAGVLDSDELRAFGRGEALTMDVSRKFNDKLKDFQKGINGLVASMSKITGSFDTAVEFLQDITNGKLFTVGADADALRSSAQVGVANLRAMASTAGVDPKEMYAMMYDRNVGFGSRFSTARGQNAYDQRFGERSSDAAAAMQSMATYLAYINAHPEADEQTRKNMEVSVHARNEGVAQGDMLDFVTLLADAQKNKVLTKEEVDELVASGDAQKVKRALQKIHGTDFQNSVRGNRQMMDWIRSNNLPRVNELMSVVQSVGTNNEAVITAQGNAFSWMTDLSNSIMSDVLEKGQGEEIEEMKLSAILSDEALEAANIKDASKKNEIRAKAKAEGWSADTARENIVKDYDGSEIGLNNAALKGFKSRLTGRYLKKGDKRTEYLGKKLDEILGNIVLPTTTSEDEINFKASKKEQEYKERLREMERDFMRAQQRGDNDAMQKARKNIGEFLDKVASGGETNYRYDGESFLSSILDSALNIDRLTEDDKDKLRKGAIGEYKKAILDQKTQDEAFENVKAWLQDQSRNKIAGIRLDDSSGFKKMARPGDLRRHLMRQSGAALIEHVMRKSGLDADQEQRLGQKALSKLTPEAMQKAREKLDKTEAFKNLSDTEKDDSVVRAAVEEALTEATRGAGIELSAYTIRNILDEKSSRQIQETSQIRALRRLLVNKRQARREAEADKTALTDAEKSKIARQKVFDQSGDANAGTANIFLDSEGKATMMSAEYSELAAEQLGDEYTAEVTRSLDDAYAIRKGETFGLPGVIDAKAAFKRSGFTKDKIDYIKSAFRQKIVELVADKAEPYTLQTVLGGGVTGKKVKPDATGEHLNSKDSWEYYSIIDIAKVLNDFDQRNKELDRDSYLRVLKDHPKIKHLGMQDLFDDANQKGIDPRAFIKSIALAASAAEQKRDINLPDDELTEIIKHGVASNEIQSSTTDKSSKDDRAVRALEAIEKFLKAKIGKPE